MPGRIRIALVADLHNGPYQSVTDILLDQKPDLIAVAGDLIHWRLVTSIHPSRNPVSDRKEKTPPVLYGLGFLHAAVQIAPTYYSLGNHELGKSSRYAGLPEQNRAFDASYLSALVSRTGAILLHDAGQPFLPGVWVGGLSSGRLHPDKRPDTGWLQGFAGQEGYKILLCHHPEYYPQIPEGIDLVLSGHAHGGQWRLFNRGFFAPDQGLFPKYSGGLYHQRMVVSRGIANTAFLAGGRLLIPRLNNPPEVVMIDLDPP